MNATAYNTDEEGEYFYLINREYLDDLLQEMAASGLEVEVRNR
jgi:hypothetical protein